MSVLKKKQRYYFYILKCKDKTLYCGITSYLKNREKIHNSGKGSAYVRTHGGGRVVYSEKYKTKGDALRREAEVKQWPRARKLALIKKLR